MLAAESNRDFKEEKFYEKCNDIQREGHGDF